jgi:polyisoprenoid-binding protein YceI
LCHKDDIGTLKELIMAKNTWVLDAAHSEVQFRVRHMMVSNVTGQLKKFDVTVDTDGEDFSTAKIRFTGDPNSISTNNEQRDGHLQSNDFFDTASHPEIIFEGEGLEKTGDDTFKLNGTLTIRGVSKPVTLDVEYGGMAKNPWGNTVAGFAVTGKINRKDFGLVYNAALETGGVLIGDEVKIFAQAEFVRQEA